jgi:hypothetical protein
MQVLLVTVLARTSSNLPEMTWYDVTRPGMLGKERVVSWLPALRQKYMSCIPWDPEPRMTVLVRASNEYLTDQQEWWMVSYMTPRVVREKYGHEYHGTWNHEQLRRGPAATYSNTVDG